LLTWTTAHRTVAHLGQSLIWTILLTGQLLTWDNCSLGTVARLGQLLAWDSCSTDSCSLGQCSPDVCSIMAVTSEKFNTARKIKLSDIAEEEDLLNSLNSRLSSSASSSGDVAPPPLCGNSTCVCVCVCEEDNSVPVFKDGGGKENATTSQQDAHDGKHQTIHKTSQEDSQSSTSTTTIAETSPFIENIFKDMLKGISDSKISMVRTGTNVPSSIISENNSENNSGNNSGVGGNTSSGLENERSKDLKRLLHLTQQLDYFIEMMCKIESSDAEDTYSVIVLYEKLIFDLKTEIASLTKRLNIVQTIVTKK